MSTSKDNPELLAHTAAIVASHVSNNTVAVADLPHLIQEVYVTLTRLGEVGAGSAAPVPAVPVSGSVTPDHIVCLEDGKKLKMLKRHLKTRFGLTPEAYRERWALPGDYPMVAPNYAKHRSSLAKQIGLGTTGGRRKYRRREAN